MTFHAYLTNILLEDLIRFDVTVQYPKFHVILQNFGSYMMTYSPISNKTCLLKLSRAQRDPQRS